MENHKPFFNLSKEQINNRTLLYFVLHYQGEEVKFLATHYSRMIDHSAEQKDYGIFYDLNHYLDSKDDLFKKTLFRYYQELNYALLDPNNLNDIANSTIKTIATHIANHFNYDEVKQWVIYQSGIPVPSEGFTEEYNELITTDKQGSREQTYIKDEYYGLIAFSLIIRALVPLFSAYIIAYSDALGGLYKEYYAFWLIRGSNITKTDAYKKLETYIDFNYRKKIEDNEYDDVKVVTKIVSGISKDDIPLWILSKTIVNRISIGPIHSEDKRRNIVVSAYRYIEQSLTNSNTGKDKENQLRFKNVSKDIEDKRTVYEKYKITTDLTPGTVVELEWAVSDIPFVIKKILEGVAYDEQEALRTVEHTEKQLMYRELGQVQINLLKAVIKPILYHKAIDYLKKKDVVRLLGVTEYVLRVKNHLYLSLLATSYPYHVDTSDYDFTIGSTSVVDHVKPELYTILDRLYPYYYTTKDKKGNPSTPIYPYRLYIENMYEQITNEIWVMTTREEIIKQITGKTDRHLGIPQAIKNIIAEFLIEQGQYKHRDIV